MDYVGGSDFMLVDFLFVHQYKHGRHGIPNTARVMDVAKFCYFLE